MVHSTETQDGAPEVTKSSLWGNPTLRLMQLRVNVAAAATFPTLKHTNSNSRAAGDSAAAPPVILERSDTPRKGEKVTTPALNSVEEAWDPRCRSPATRTSSDGVVVAPTRSNAQDSEGASGETPTRAASLL